VIYQELNFAQLPISNPFRIKAFPLFVQNSFCINFNQADLQGAVLSLMDIVAGIKREFFGEKQIFAKHMQTPAITNEIV